jgi:hypothetical protein
LCALGRLFFPGSFVVNAQKMIFRTPPDELLNPVKKPKKEQGKEAAYCHVVTLCNTL